MTARPAGPAGNTGTASENDTETPTPAAVLEPKISLTLLGEPSAAFCTEDSCAIPNIVDNAG